MEEVKLLEDLKNQIELLEHQLSQMGNQELVALDIAVRIRVLVHDTNASISLLTHLNKKNILYYDSCSPPGSISNWMGNFSITGWNTAILPHIGIVGKDVKVLDAINFSITYFPIFKVWPKIRDKVDFDQWWNTIIFDNRQGQTLTRKELILNLANKAGGAHIDKASESYNSFSHKDVMKFNMNHIIQGANNIPVYSCVAQIGWELLHSIKEEFGL